MVHSNIKRLSAVLLVCALLLCVCSVASLPQMQRRGIPALI